MRACASVLERAHFSSAFNAQLISIWIAFVVSVEDWRFIHLAITTEVDWPEPSKPHERQRAHWNLFNFDEHCTRLNWIRIESL